VAVLFGEQVCGDLVEISGREHPAGDGHRAPGFRVSALAGGTATARATGKFQYIFLNGRFIRNKSISHAIRRAYEGLIEPGRFPVVFLFIEAAPASVDVNVHPTKIEVRFRNASLVHSQVLGTLREALVKAGLRQPGRIPQPLAAAAPPPLPVPMLIRRQVAEPAAGFKPVHDGGAAPKRQKFMQIHDAFILVETGEGFLLIDQHALHERLIYDRLREKMRRDRFESQRLLLPETLQLDEAEAEIVRKNAELFERLGIELAEFGPKTWAIQAFPAALSNDPPRGGTAVKPRHVGPVRFVRDLLDLLGGDSADDAAEAVLESVLRMAACKAAVKAGSRLTESEIEQLLEDSGGSRTVRCPHGRPAVIEFSIAEMERQFNRTGPPLSRTGR
jgi:DNA mismatch repair protein MutL